MVKFLGTKNEEIHLISSTPFVNKEYTIIEVSKELDNLTPQEIILNYKIRNGQLYNKNSKKNIKDLKVAFINNWKMKCGISTYSEQLYQEIIPYLGEYKLFIEKNQYPTGKLNQLGNLIISEENIISCWERGKPLKELITEVHKFNPDLCIIQHEFGIWPDAKYWLSLMSQLNKYRTIVVMHSTFHHQDKSIFEASCQEIIVHLEGAKNLLENEKQISGNVYVIPHGCPNKLTTERLWNSYKSPHTLLQTGFGFRYKSFQSTIKAVSLLKDKYPDIFFTALFSESPFNKIEHGLYFNELIKLTNDLGLENHVGIIRGFQSENVVSAFLKMNNVLVFPYENDPANDMYGASGAVRVGMGYNLPVISSNINHFSDIPTLKCSNPKEIANTLDKLFSSPKLVEEQLKKQEDYLKENSWIETAKRYIEVMEKGK